MTDDPINPAHYKQSDSGYEAIDFTEVMNCPNLANAFKYVWRHEHKGRPEEDLNKCLFYLDRERDLRNRWTRPLRFDTASGQPIGHLPEDDMMFDDFHSKSQSLPGLASLTAIWTADMTTGLSTLGVARMFVERLIEERGSD